MISTESSSLFYHEGGSSPTILSQDHWYMDLSHNRQPRLGTDGRNAGCGLEWPQVLSRTQICDTSLLHFWNFFFFAFCLFVLFSTKERTSHLNSEGESHRACSQLGDTASLTCDSYTSPHHPKGCSCLLCKGDDVRQDGERKELKVDLRCSWTWSKNPTKAQLLTCKPG